MGVCYVEVKGCREEEAESIGFGLVGRAQLIVVHPLAMVPNTNSPAASVRLTAKVPIRPQTVGSSARTVGWNECARSWKSGVLAVPLVMTVGTRAVMRIRGQGLLLGRPHFADF
jgi:hypothetical protein